MQQTQTQLSGLPLAARWILVNALSWFTGVTLGLLVLLAARNIHWINEDRVFAYAALCCIGLASSVEQWLVMKEILPRARRWILATLIGYGLTPFILAALNLLKVPGAQLWSNILLFALLGACIAIPQWWLLRQYYHQAGIWILATMVGFQFFLWMTSNPANSQSDLISVVTILGALSGILTGFALTWITRQPRSM